MRQGGGARRPQRVAEAMEFADDSVRLGRHSLRGAPARGASDRENRSLGENLLHRCGCPWNFAHVLPHWAGFRHFVVRGSFSPNALFFHLWFTSRIIITTLASCKDGLKPPKASKSLLLGRLPDMPNFVSVRRSGADEPLVARRKGLTGPEVERGPVTYLFHSSFQRSRLIETVRAASLSFSRRRSAACIPSDR